MKTALIAIAVGVALLQPIKTEYKDIKVPQEVADYTEVASGWFGISQGLLESICFYESSFRKNVSNGSCVGYMGVNKNFHQKRAENMGLSDLFDGYTNIIVASDYLEELFEKYEDAGLVLMVYHGESDAVEKYQNGELSSYAKKVLELADYLEESK